MRLSPVLLLLFLSLPVAEIYLLIQVGGWIGAGWTLLLLLASAVLGIRLVRAQGLATARRLQVALAQGVSPAVEMLEGLCLLIAGILLVIPGFLTDIIGFILLIPWLRRQLIRVFLRRRPNRSSTVVHPGPIPTPGERTPLEGESKRLKENPNDMRD